MGASQYFKFKYTELNSLDQILRSAPFFLSTKKNWYVYQLENEEFPIIEINIQKHGLELYSYTMDFKRKELNEIITHLKKQLKNLYQEVSFEETN